MLCGSDGDTLVLGWMSDADSAHGFYVWYIARGDATRTDGLDMNEYWCFVSRRPGDVPTIPPHSALDIHGPEGSTTEW